MKSHGDPRAEHGTLPERHFDSCYEHTPMTFYERHYDSAASGQLLHIICANSGISSMSRASDLGGHNSISNASIIAVRHPCIT